MISILILTHILIELIGWIFVIKRDSKILNLHILQCEDVKASSLMKIAREQAEMEVLKEIKIAMLGNKDDFALRYVEYWRSRNRGEIERLKMDVEFQEAKIKELS